MKVRIEKKGDRQYLVLLASETDVKGFYLSREDLAKLRTNTNEILDYPDRLEVGDAL